MRGAFLAALAAVGLAGGLAGGIAGAALAQDPENVLVIDIEGAANGTVEIELLPEVAPLHAERLRTLAREGAYDGVVFHRVIDGFMAQTGDVEFGKEAVFAQGQAGLGGSSLPDLPAEVSNLSFDKGVVGMARARDPDSANSQFFIMFAPAPHLDGGYTVVGRVISGQEVVDAIQRGGGPNGQVADPDVMARVRVKSDI